QAMLTDEDRVLGHRLAGDWLERAGGAEAVVLAEHFERGGEPARAVAWWRRAAEQALEGDDLESALQRAGRGISSGAAAEPLGQLRRIQAEAHAWRAEFALSAGRGTEAMALLHPASPAWYKAAAMTIASAGYMGDRARMAST